MKNKLERFLKDRRLYAEFVREFRRVWAEKGENYLEEFCETTPRENLIAYAFYWFKTKRGHEFWDKINREWLKS